MNHKPVSVYMDINTTGFLRCWFKGKLYLIKLLKLPFKSLSDTRGVFARFNSLCEQCTQTGKHYSLMFNPGSHSISDLTMEHALTIKL